MPIATERPLDRARVALIYGPGNLAVDYAAALPRGLERALLDLGASVSTLNLALFKRHVREPYPSDSPLVRGIVDFSREGDRFDLCLGLFHDAYLTDELAETLRSRCARTINYPLNLLDQPHRFERALQICDQTFCAEEAALDSLRAKAPGRVRYVPMAADPWIFRRLGAPAEPRLLFVGSLYAERQWLLDRCAAVIPTSAFGPGHDVPGVARGLARELVRRRRVPRPLQAARMLARAAFRDRRVVSDEEFVRLAAEHGVSVGFSEVRQERTGALFHKVRLREYEAAMSGLCHLARRLPELERGFDGGREMVLYDDPAGIPELLSRIRAGDLDFRSIGEAARRRAERDHTWTERLRAAFTA